MAQIVQIVGIAAGVVTAASSLPQLFKMIKEKKSTDISVLMFASLISGLGLWTWYGILKNDWPIITTNSFSLLINSVIIVLQRRYKK